MLAGSPTHGNEIRRLWEELDTSGRISAFLFFPLFLPLSFLLFPPFPPLFPFSPHFLFFLSPHFPPFPLLFPPFSPIFSLFSFFSSFLPFFPFFTLSYFPPFPLTFSSPFFYLFSRVFSGRSLDSQTYLSIYTEKAGREGQRKSVSDEDAVGHQSTEKEKGGVGRRIRGCWCPQGSEGVI